MNQCLAYKPQMREVDLDARVSCKVLMRFAQTQPVFHDAQLLKNRETFVCIKEEFKTLLELVQLDIPFTVKILGAFHDLAQLHFVMVCRGGWG